MDSWFQSLGFLLGTIWLYRFIRIKHEAWTKELRAFRSLELSGNPNTDPDVKVVTDKRLGRLGYASIWCGHPGANHNCTLCKLNRQHRLVEPPPPIYPDGPRYHVEPAIPPPPPPTAMPGEPERQSR